MRWFPFAVAAYLMLVLQTGLSTLLSMELNYSGAVLPIRPEFLVILGAMVGLFASRGHAIIGWGILGLLADLASPMPTAGDASITLIGPNVLGSMAAAYFLLTFRTMVFRQHPLTIATVVFFCGLASKLIVISLLSIRHRYAPLADYSGVHQLLSHALGLLYTAGIALLLSPLLMRLAPILGLNTSRSAGGRSSRR